MNNNSRSGITRIYASLAAMLIILVGVSASAAGPVNTRQFAVRMNMVGDLGEMQGQEITMTFYVDKKQIRVEMNIFIVVPPICDNGNGRKCKEFKRRVYRHLADNEPWRQDDSRCNPV